tara:strand:+ start:834 stop:1019 length:186 start_codon:yes stop_codon:yes gene_type:complete
MVRNFGMKKKELSLPILLDQYKKGPLEVDRIKTDTNMSGKASTTSKIIDENISKKRFIKIF